jgi:hypothetical protein
MDRSPQMETSDARKRHAEEQRLVDSTLADQAAIQICGFNIPELMAIRDGLHQAGALDLFADAARTRAHLAHTKFVARIWRQRAEKAERENARLREDLRARYGR